MSNILTFHAPARSCRSRADLADQQGVILFFTGVRYERSQSVEQSANAAEAPASKPSERLQRKAAATKRSAAPKARPSGDSRKSRAKTTSKLVGNGGKNTRKRRA